MSHERVYSNSAIEFVKKAYLEQLHFSVLTALDEKKRNIQVSPAYINLPLFGRRDFGDFARGYNFEKAKEAPRPEALVVGQSVSGSALIATLNHMSYDRDFDGVADLVDLINSLQFTRSMPDWVSAIEAISQCAAKIPVVALRFSDLKTLFIPQPDSQTNVDALVATARGRYPSQVLSKQYTFSSVMPAVKKSKSQAMRKASWPNLNCFKFSSRSAYEKLVDQVGSEVKEGSLVNSLNAADSVVVKAETLFTQYFVTRKMGNGSEWQTCSQAVADNSGFSAQVKAARSVVKSLRLLENYRVDQAEINRELQRCVEEIAGFMHEAQMRKGWGYSVSRFFSTTYCSSLFSSALETVAVNLSQLPEFSDALAHKQAQLNNNLKDSLNEEACLSRDDISSDSSSDDRIAELAGNVCVDSNGLNQISHAKEAIKSKIRRQLGINKCFDSILRSVQQLKGNEYGTFGQRVSSVCSCELSVSGW